MKTLLPLLFASAFMLAACTKTDAVAAQSPVVEVKPAEPAKSAEPATTKQVCLDVKDKAGNVVKNKDGSVKQNCKTVKVHRKFEGTKVPPK